MNLMQGLRAAMAAVGDFYQERGIFQDRFADVVSLDETLAYLRHCQADPAVHANDRTVIPGGRPNAIGRVIVG